MRITISILIAVLLVLFLSSCSEPNYIAIVNGEKILVRDFNRNLAQLKQYYPETEENDLKKYLLEDMIVDKLILQRAKNITVSESEVEQQYEALLETYASEQALLQDLQKYGFTKEELLKDIREQLIIAKHLENIENIDNYIEELVQKADIKIRK
ncbi:MAG TPA: hypothetical protein GX502_08005 [Syntrophaceticus sp.]|nr:hypothetical protein [Syntrophaceticus sp.]